MKISKDEIYERIERAILLGNIKIDTVYPMQGWRKVRVKLQELLIDIRG